MIARQGDTEQTLDLPPGYTLVALRELGDAFAHASEIAAEAGAGTLVWVRRYDLVEFAVVLEPDEPLRSGRLVSTGPMRSGLTRGCSAADASAGRPNAPKTTYQNGSFSA